MTTIRIDARHPHQLQLDATEVAIIRHPAGVRIRCTEGVAWITQGPRSRDMVLYAGQSIVLNRRKPVYVSSLQACRCRLQPAESPRSLLARAATLLGSLRLRAPDATQ